MNQNTTPAAAIATDSFTKTFFITDPDGGQHLLIRVTAEIPTNAQEPVFGLAQDIVEEAQERISKALFGL